MRTRPVGGMGPGVISVLYIRGDAAWIPFRAEGSFQGIWNMEYATKEGIDPRVEV